MAIQRLCDRCHALASEPPKAGAIPIPASDPATAPGAIALDVVVDVQTPNTDLCAVCRTAVVTEYVLARIDKAALTPEVVIALSGRIKAALQPPAVILPPVDLTPVDVGPVAKDPA